jgi:hypothetical protein
VQFAVPMLIEFLHPLRFFPHLFFMNQRSFIVPVMQLQMPAIDTLDAQLDYESLVIHSLQNLAVNPPTTPR